MQMCCHTDKFHWGTPPPTPSFPSLSLPLGIRAQRPIALPHPEHQLLAPFKIPLPSAMRDTHWTNFVKLYSLAFYLPASLGLVVFLSF